MRCAQNILVLGRSLITRVRDVAKVLLGVPRLRFGPKTAKSDFSEVAVLPFRRPSGQFFMFGLQRSHSNRPRNRRFSLVFLGFSAPQPIPVLFARGKLRFGALAQEWAESGEVEPKEVEGLGISEAVGQVG